MMGGSWIVFVVVMCVIMFCNSWWAIRRWESLDHWRNPTAWRCRYWRSWNCKIPAIINFFLNIILFYLCLMTSPFVFSCFVFVFVSLSSSLCEEGDCECFVFSSSSFLLIIFLRCAIIGGKPPTSFPFVTCDLIPTRFQLRMLLAFPEITILYSRGTCLRTKSADETRTRVSASSRSCPPSTRPQTSAFTCNRKRKNKRWEETDETLRKCRNMGENIIRGHWSLKK